MGIDIFGLDVLYLLMLMGVGMCAGFINAMAFGGSMLTVPTLIYLIPYALNISSIPFAIIHIYSPTQIPQALNISSLTTNLANGTNRVAIFFQNLSAILGYRRKGVSNFRHAIVLTIPAVVGAGIGAFIGTETPDRAFKPILAVVMMTILFLTFFNPTEWLHQKINPSGTQYKIITSIVLFIVGIYGGFIQIGTGLLIIATLQILDGEDLVITNAHKVFIIFFYTIIALVIFVSKGQVNWVLGLTLATGNATGAWIGSHFAVKMGDKWIKVVLVIAVIASVTKLLWDTFKF